jgi:hypothetical protein
MNSMKQVALNFNLNLKKTRKNFVINGLPTANGADRLPSRIPIYEAEFRKVLDDAREHK